MSKLMYFIILISIITSCSNKQKVKETAQKFKEDIINQEDVGLHFLEVFGVKNKQEFSELTITEPIPFIIFKQQYLENIQSFKDAFEFSDNSNFLVYYEKDRLKKCKAVINKGGTIGFIATLCGNEIDPPNGEKQTVYVSNGRGGGTVVPKGQEQVFYNFILTDLKGNELGFNKFNNEWYGKTIIKNDNFEDNVYYSLTEVQQRLKASSNASL